MADSRPRADAVTLSPSDQGLLAVRGGQLHAAGQSIERGVPGFLVDRDADGRGLVGAGGDGVGLDLVERPAHVVLLGRGEDLAPAQLLPDLADAGRRVFVDPLDLEQGAGLDDGGRAVEVDHRRPCVRGGLDLVAVAQWHVPVRRLPGELSRALDTDVPLELADAGLLAGRPRASCHLERLLGEALGADRGDPRFLVAPVGERPVRLVEGDAGAATHLVQTRAGREAERPPRSAPGPARSPRRRRGADPRR